VTIEAAEAKKIFCDECEKRQINVKDRFILGRGSSNNDGRYKQKIKRDKIQESHLYAIQYCRDIDVFVAWNLKAARCVREVYTAGRDKLLDIDNSRVYEVRKNIEYSGWDEEDVLAFKKETISEFLEKYISSN